MHVLLLVAFIACCFSTSKVNGEVELECVNDSCTECYKTLATELLKNVENYRAMQRIFFPPDDSAGPDFITVTYQYYEGNETESHLQNISNCTVWFWSSSAFFFYYPLSVFQLTSLGFSDPAMRESNLTLYLPVSCYEEELPCHDKECQDIHDEYKEIRLLTQRVSC